MGWTSENRPNGHTTQEWFALKFDAHYTIKASAVVNGVFYAAVHDSRDDRTFAFVALTKRGSGYFNFTYKDMDESMGPCDAEAPARVLDLLSPTEHEYALEWRAACRKAIAAKEAQPNRGRVTAGAKVVFAQALEFNDAYIDDTFTWVKGSTFRRADGRLAQITSWRKRSWKVAAA